MWLKAALFILGALLCAGLLFADSPQWRTLALAALLGWCAARAYYFLFYVIEHYIDETFTYAGLGALLKAWWQQRAGRR